MIIGLLSLLIPVYLSGLFEDFASAHLLCSAIATRAVCCGVWIEAGEEEDVVGEVEEAAARQSCEGI